MTIKIRTDKQNKVDDYVISSNHIPRYKEFIELDNHRFVVNYVVYECIDVYDLDKSSEIEDVILYVTEIY